MPTQEEIETALNGLTSKADFYEDGKMLDHIITLRLAQAEARVLDLP